ncbi:MAG: PilN domain-containing protein [Acidobacteriota bacterium]
MLKVNLLPESARQATLSPIEQFHRTPLMWLVVGAMLLFVLVLLVPLGIDGQRLHGLQAQIQVLQPKKLEVDRVQRFVRGLRAQQGAFRSMKQGGGKWAKRLNVLSDVTPDGVWFTELELDQDKGLIIRGSAIGQGGSEMVSVGRLRSDLKADPDFAAAIEDIQIESIKRIQEKNIEIVQFTLACALRKAPELD